MVFAQLISPHRITGWYIGLLLSSWYSTIPVSAQNRQPNCTLTLSGQVRDHETQEVLPGTTVVILRPDGSVAAATETDAFGNYHLHDLCDGTYRVRFTYIGFAPEIDDVKLVRPLALNPQLHPDGVQLGGAVVRGERPVAPTGQAVVTLAGAELRATHGQTLGEALTKIAGVTALQTGPSIYKPMIHGLHSNRITLLNNGVRQEGQQWGQEHGPEIDPFIAGNLTVVKGAAAVRYGADAIGGVVLVQPSPLRDSAGIGGKLSLVGASNNRLGAASATIDGNFRRLPPLSWRLQGTLRRAGNTRTPDYYLKNSGFAEYDYSGAVGWARERWGIEAFFSSFNTRLGILSASHVGNLTDLQRAFESPQPLELAGFTYRIDRPYQQVRHQLLKGRVWWRAERLGKLELTVARQLDQRDEYDKFRPRNDNLAARNLPELSYLNRTTTADFALDHKPLSGHLTGSAGVSATYQDNSFAGRYFIPFYTNQVLGAFAIERWSCGRWLVEAGGRLEYHDLLIKRAEGTTASYTVRRSSFRLWTPAASAGMAYEAGPHLTLRLGGALNQRAPAPNERYSQGVHNGQYEEGHDLRLAAGEQALGPETARSGSITATVHDNPHWNGELTTYLTHISGFIYATPILPPILTIRGPFPSYRFLQTDARFAGVDATASWTPTPLWLVLAKAAIVRTRDLRQADDLIFTPADRAELAVRRTFGTSAPTHRIGACYVQISSQGVARQTRLPANYEALDYRRPPPAIGCWALRQAPPFAWGTCPST